MIYLCNNESYFRSFLCIFMGLKMIGKFCSSVLIIPTQEARIILFIFNVETDVWALALDHRLAPDFLSAPLCLGRRDVMSCH